MLKKFRVAFSNITIPLSSQEFQFIRSVIAFQSLATLQSDHPSLLLLPPRPLYLQPLVIAVFERVEFCSFIELYLQ